MFYSQYVLTKKGPLAKIWLAAHMQSKLTKTMVFGIDVRKAVDKIMAPEAPMALRLTSNLLLGVCRVLSRKTKYLLQESNEAITKMKLTFRKGATSNLDLPADENNANFNAITLDADTPARAPLLDLDLLPRPGRRQSDRNTQSSSFLAAERDITIDEFAGGLAGNMNDAFALDPEILRERDEDMSVHQPLMFTPSQRTPNRSASPAVASVLSIPRSTVSLGSVEAMRSATPGPAGPLTPRLSDTPGREGLPEPEVARAAPAELVLQSPRLADPIDDPIPPPPVEDDEPMPPQPVDEDVIIPQAEVEPPLQARLSLDDAALQLPADPAADARLSLGADDDLVLEDNTSQAPGQQLQDEQPQSPQTQTLTLTQTEDQQVATPSQRGRKRKVFARVDEEKTELTAAEFRACLNDTSDLLRRPRAKRRAVAQVQTETAQQSIAKPPIPMPAQMDALFAQWFAEEVHRVSSPLSEPERGDKDKSAEAEPQREASPVPQASDDQSMAPSEHSASRRSASAGPGSSPGVSVQAQPEFLPPEMEIVEAEPIPPPVDDLPPPPEEELMLPSLEIPDPIPAPEDVVEPLAKQHVDEPVPDVAFEGSIREVAFTRVEVDKDGEGERMTKRALKMRQLVANRLENDEFNLSSALKVENCSRKVAARAFYEVLNLCSRRLVTLEQDVPYGDVVVAPSRPAFDNVQA